MKITKDSHLDHHITPEQKAYVLEQFGSRDEFFIETLTLPEALGTVPCGLHGPLMGDDPVPETEVRYAARGDRIGESRLCKRPVRPTDQLTIIAGPHDGERCVLYTAFGGPVAPREPFDPGLEDNGERDKSLAFWAEHALSEDE
jgi:hypothetical protein